MSLKDYTMGMLLQDIGRGMTIHDLMNAYPDNKGHILDGIARCVVAFRAAPEFSKAKLLVGNSNHGLAELKNAKGDFLDTLVNNSCANGMSDVSFVDDKILYLSSSKFFQETKNIDDYDVSGLVQLWDKVYRHQYKECRYIVFVRSKTEFYQMLKRANKANLNHVDLVFGITEMDRMLATIYDMLLGNTAEHYLRVFTNTERSPLMLRPHQKVCVHMTLTGQDARRLLGLSPRPFLWAMLPRSGKSFMTAGHIVGSILQGMKTFLLVTPIPNETIRQFKDDLFDRIAEFAEVDVLVGDEIAEHVRTYQENLAAGRPTRPFVAMMSKQLDHSASRTDPERLGVAGDFCFDTIYFDEAHCGGTTELSQKMFASYTDPERTQLIMMTATHYKPYQVMGIPKENVIPWDLDAMEAARVGDMSTLYDIYGPHLDAANTTPEELRHIYSHEPRFCLMSAFHKPSIVERFRHIHGEKTTRLGADMDRIFDLNANNQFSHPDAIHDMVHLLLGSGKDTDDRKTVMDMVRDHANTHGGRGNRKGLSQLWFLPYGPGRQIEHVSCSLKDILAKEHKEGQRYHVASLYDCTGDMRSFVAMEEAKCRSMGKKGTILLAGEKGSMGISLPKVDIVVLLTHCSSADNVYQKMWRCMTGDENKTYGYVVDMDAHRVLNTLMMYDTNSHNSTKPTVRERIVRLSKIVDLVDLLCVRMDREDIVEELHNIWREDMHTRLGTFDRRLAEIGLVFDEEDARAMRAILRGCSSSKSAAANRVIELNGSEQRLPQSTYDVVKNGVADDMDALADQLGAATITDEPEEKPEKEYDLTEMLPTVFKLATILTFHKEGAGWTNLLGTIQGILQDPYLSGVFEQQCSIYWDTVQRNLSGFKSVLIHTIQKLKPSVERDTKEVMEAIREHMMQLSLNDKAGLLDYLNEQLPPKEGEKKKLGEVFTPLSLVEEMLDKLPSHVWGNPTLKWFDPAVGIGNFVVCAYYRLMEGLAEVMPDEADRSRHIITEMLYMSEINQKNVHMCRLIFGEDANIHHGDTLQLDIMGKWGIEEFDVVMGNPPYNTEQKSTGSSPLYHLFIQKFIDHCTYLSYIIPSRWFSGGKGLEAFRRHMLGRGDIQYIRHFPNASQIFGRKVEIKGGVCYFLKDAEHKGQCVFNGTPITLDTFDILVEDRYHGLVHKLKEYPSITALFRSQTHYNINTNDARLCDDASLVKCYVSKQKGYAKYIDNAQITAPYDTFKVITARASTANYDCFGNMFLGRPGEVHSKSYISFEVAGEAEGNSLLSYLKLRLPNLMLKLRKNSQDINEATCRWIVLPPLDRTWTDADVYDHFGLTEDEIRLVEDTEIVGYRPIR